MKNATWDELKSGGSAHYKSIGGAVEPIDLYRAKGVFKAFALCSIIKYAVRNTDKELNPVDIRKIIHYAKLLLAENEDKDVSSNTEGQIRPGTSDRLTPQMFTSGTEHLREYDNQVYSAIEEPPVSPQVASSTPLSRQELRNP